MTDKDSYETYEYLPDGNDADQFFLVQDDGTFLSLNNSQVQYMTQRQEIKEIVNNVQPCTVYDVTSPQFLIDVNNAAEVISVPDQLMLPNGENIIISDNYLLPEPNTEEQIVQQDEVIQYEEPEKHNNAEVDNVMQNPINNCTEITLSDEQFHILEQKGWILLETIDKVYVLDTLGLHDITNNDKLIQKLKSSEGSNECIQEEISLNQQDNIQLEIREDGVKLSEDIIENHDLFFINSKINHQRDESMESSILDKPNETNTKLEAFEAQNNVNTTQDTIENDVFIKNVQNKQEKNVTKKKVNSKLKNTLKTTKKRNVMFKVNTNIAFKDIPDKIALGETKNGKKLFAKITKLNSIDVPSKKYSPQYAKGVLGNKTVSSDTKEKKINSMSVEEQLFETLLSQVRAGREVRCSARDVAAAHTTVTQLLQIPDFKTSVFDRNLIITKVVSLQDAAGAYSSGGQAALVPGRVAALDGRHCFVHVPDMLHQIMNIKEDCKQDIKEEKADGIFMDNYVLHVHVNEVKRADNVLRVSITLNTRKLPIKTKSEDNIRKLSSKAFACPNCANIFNTEDDLKQHQQADCLDVEGDLSIDSDSMVSGYTTVEENGKIKIYSCNQCNMKFMKLHNCLKHLKTHYSTEINITNDMEQNELMAPADKAVKNMHKCKMCPSIFNYQQTLVKHILNKHIKKNITN